MDKMTFVEVKAGIRTIGSDTITEVYTIDPDDGWSCPMVEDGHADDYFDKLETIGLIHSGGTVCMCNDTHL
jgi:hypothetical protein